VTEAPAMNQNASGGGEQGSKTLASLLDRMEKTTEGDDVSIGELAKALERRGVGALLVLTSLLAILPTGAIPGMSLFTGVIMLVLSIELLFGHGVWLPRFVTKRTIPRETLETSIERARGPAEWIGRYLKPRYETLLGPPFIHVLAVFGVVISLSMFPLALVPFGAFPAGVAFLVIGTGLMVRDGLVIALGIALGLVGLVAAWYLWPY
jgi:hypothetical protein